MRPRDLLVAFQIILLFESFITPYLDSELPEESSSIIFDKLKAIRPIII